jgi:DNA repair ATPase RecN
LEEKSSSYTIPHNPPVSQSARLEQVVSKNLKDKTLTEKLVRIAKEERQGDVRKLGGKANESVGLEDSA